MNPKTYLPLLVLSKEASEALIFPKLQASNILSLVKVCQDGCQVVITNKDINITKGEDVTKKMNKNNIIIQDKSNPMTKSWFFDQNQNSKDNRIITYYNNKNNIEQINSIQITGTNK